MARPKTNVIISASRVKDVIQNNHTTINAIANEILSDKEADYAIRRFRQFLKDEKMPPEILSRLSEHFNVPSEYFVGEKKEHEGRYMKDLKHEVRIMALECEVKIMTVLLKQLVDLLEGMVKNEAETAAICGKIVDVII